MHARLAHVDLPELRHFLLESPEFHDRERSKKALVPDFLFERGRSAILPRESRDKKRQWGSRHVWGSRQRSISVVDFGTFQSEKYRLTISPFMSREVATPGGGFADRISK